MSAERVREQGRMSAWESARSHTHTAILLLLILAAFALRLYHLDAMSFWSDEGISVLRARNDLPTLLATLPIEHTPLYFVGLHCWMALTGEGDFAVRFFSLLFSVLTIPLVYKLGVSATPLLRAGESLPLRSREASHGQGVGVIAALLATINPLQIWYAQEARMYALVVAFCAGAAWCLLRATNPLPTSPVEKRDRRGQEPVLSLPKDGGRYYLAFALLSAAALYTHFFAVLIVAAFALWATWVLIRNRVNARPLIAAFMLIGLLFSPWLPRALGALSFPGWQAAADPLSLPARYLAAYTLGSTIGDDGQWLSLGFLLLLTVGAVILARRADAAAWLPIGYVFVPFALLMLLALRKPGYHERYLIVITPMVFVILAVALDAIRHATSLMRLPYDGSRIAFSISLLFIIISSALSLNHLYFDARYAKPDFRAAAQYIDRLSRAGDGLIFDGPDPHKAFYRYFSRQRVVAFDENNFDTQDVADSERFLTAQVPLRERWWVVLYFHPSGPTEAWLARQGYQTSSRWFNGIRVLLYATPTEAALSTRAPAAVQTQLPLQIVHVRTRPGVQVGDVLPVIVRWQANGPLPADYQVSLRLVDESGKLIKQQDGRPLNGRIPTSQWQVGAQLEDRYGLLVPDEVASGNYHVQLILYRLNASEVLRAQLADVRIEP